MKYAISILLLFASVCFAQNKMDTWIDQSYPSLDAIYKNLHTNPELSYQEEKTSQMVAGELREAGYEVTDHLGKYPDPKLTGYGVVGVLKNGPGPTVLVRTDMDALPVEEKTGLPYASTAKGKADDGTEVSVMHACGHDIHTTVFVAVARYLASIKSLWRGTLIMVGQPAEERAPGGAQALLADGLYTKFPKPDYCLALHDNAGLETGKVGYGEGYIFAAVDTVDITVRGTGGHGAYPHLTKDPIVMASELVLALQTIVSREVTPGDPAVITVGSIHGGTKHNIIPDEVHLQITVRSYKKETRDLLLNSIQRITKAISQAGGGKDPVIDLHPDALVPATYNNPDLVKKTVPALIAAVGKDNVVPVAPTMGGEDFSWYSLDDLSVPSFQFWIGAVDPAKVAESKKTGQPLPSLHSSLFAPVPESTIKTGFKAMSAAVLNLMKKQ